MDLSNPQTWKDGASVVIGAPHIVGPLLAAVAIGVWWFRAAIGGAEVRGLKGTIGELKERIGVLEERLRLASDREKDVKEKRDELEKQVQELRAQIAAEGAASEKVRAITAKVEAALGEFTTANTALSTAITGVEAKGEVGRIGVTISSDLPNSATKPSN